MRFLVLILLPIMFRCAAVARWLIGSLLTDWPSLIPQLIYTNKAHISA